MARNPQPTSYPGLVLLSQRCLNGATLLGAEIPLVLNTAARIEADRNAMLAAQAAFQAGCGTSPAISGVVKSARAAAYDFGHAARDVLKNFLGRTHSEAWRPTGFIRNLEVPRPEAGLMAMLAALSAYFTAHPAYENPALNVTATRAEALLASLTTARQAFDALKGGCRTEREARDAAVKAMHRRLGHLLQELKQVLSPLDPRWLEFGLNMPGAASVPAAPENVVAQATLPGQVQVSCEASVTAAGYRFYRQRPILDPEPILAGGASMPLFILTGLEAGVEQLVYVSAVNAGGESELSEPVAVVVSAQARAPAVAA